jgi:uncharacterized protein YdcH (DUF465 family)
MFDHHNDIYQLDRAIWSTYTVLYNLKELVDMRNNMIYISYYINRHHKLDQKLIELEKIRPEVLTSYQEKEIKRLKKQKLKLKDYMESMIAARKKQETHSP